eukprot:g82384.t1
MSFRVVTYSVHSGCVTASGHVSPLLSIRLMMCIISMASNGHLPARHRMIVQHDVMRRLWLQLAHHTCLTAIYLPFHRGGGAT